MAVIGMQTGTKSSELISDGRILRADTQTIPVAEGNGNLWKCLECKQRGPCIECQLLCHTRWRGCGLAGCGIYAELMEFISFPWLSFTTEKQKRASASASPAPPPPISAEFVLEQNFSICQPSAKKHQRLAAICLKQTRLFFAKMLCGSRSSRGGNSGNVANDSEAVKGGRCSPRHAYTAKWVRSVPAFRKHTPKTRVQITHVREKPMRVKLHQCERAIRPAAPFNQCERVDFR